MCAANISKTGLQIKILWQTIILNKDFALAREIIRDHVLSILTALLTFIRRVDHVYTVYVFCDS